MNDGLLYYGLSRTKGEKGTKGGDCSNSCRSSKVQCQQLLFSVRCPSARGRLSQLSLSLSAAAAAAMTHTRFLVVVGILLIFLPAIQGLEICTMKIYQ